MRAAALVFGLAVTASPAGAGSLVVDAEPCATRIRIDADQVPLGEVLERLSNVMGFRLVAKTSLVEPVSLSVVGTPEDVLKRLMQGRNLVVDSNPSKKCSGRTTPTTVWVLPAGEAGNRPAAPAAAAPPAAAATQTTAPVSPRGPRPRGTRQRMSEAEWQQMKKDYKAGKVQADPETGLPVPVEQQPEQEAPKP